MPRLQRLSRKAQARPIEFHSMEQSRKTSAKVNKSLWVSREYMAMGGKNWLRFRLQNTHLSPAVAFSSQMKRRRAMDFMTSNAEKRCSCHFLYNGEIAKWGCHWFSQWKEQTLRAHGRRCKLVVVTKKDGSLGRSQAGEVQFLEAEKIPYESITIEQFARRIFDRRDRRRRRRSGLLRSSRRVLRSDSEEDGLDMIGFFDGIPSNRLLRSDSEEDGLDKLQYSSIYPEADSAEDGPDKIQYSAI